MKIQINSDKQTLVSAELREAIGTELNRALERFSARLTRVEVHLSDLNSAKPGLRDKRCILEARPAGQKPVSVASDAGTVEGAVKSAAGKMKRLLETSFGRTLTKSVRKGTRTAQQGAALSGALSKLERIEEALSSLMKRARSIMESESSDTATARPSKRRKMAASSTGRKTASAKKTTTSGRGTKKKPIYRARRKAWPVR